MKHFKNYLACLTVFALIFTSCSKDDAAADLPSEEVAVLTLAADLGLKSNNKQAIPDCAESDPAFALISFSYADVVEENLEIEILHDDGGWFTAYHDQLEIPVPTGQDYVQVTLNDFRVFDGSDNLIWAAPKKNSDFAVHVGQAVGEDFIINLRAGSKNYTNVEVLCFDDREVNRYGYQFFDIIPTELQPLCFFANYCPTGPNGRDKVADYVLNLYHFTGTPEGTPDTSGEAYIEMYANQMLSPEQGLEGGNYFADPLCTPIPYLDEGEYIYYEATLADWPNNYAAGGEGFVSGYLDQGDLDMLLGDDEDTVDYVHLFFNCGDTPPPPSGDCPAGSDPDGDGLCNPNDDCPNTHTDEDMDGDCIPDDEDPCPYDPENNCEGDNPVGEGCETAFMFGDYELNELGLYNGNSWGWGHVIDGDDDGVWEIPFYAGAGQNDYENSGYQAGNIVLTLDDGWLTVEFDLYDDVERNDTHVWVGGNWPDSRAPGQFDLDDNEFDVSELDEIYIIVHAEVCGDDDDDDED